MQRAKRTWRASGCDVQAADLLKKMQDGTTTEEETKRFRVVSAMV